MSEGASERPRRRRRRAKRQRKPLAERTLQARLKAKRILYGPRVAGDRIFDPVLHPAELIAYFQKILDEVKAVERVETDRGDVKYVQEPAKPPTLAGFAAHVGVRRETLWAWGKEHEEFQLALDRARAIQEDIIIDMGAKGAYPPQFVGLMMKNLHQWADKVEQKNEGALVIHFDAQDAEA